MKIESYSVSQSSAHSLVKEESTSETLNAWIGDPNNANSAETPAFFIDIDMSRFQVNTERSYLNNDIGAVTGQAYDSRIDLLESLVYALTGKHIKFKDPTVDMQNGSGGSKSNLGIAYDYRELKSENEDKSFNSGGKVIMTDGRNIAFDWGIAYDYREVKSEKENVTFKSGGYVKTADGRTIAFDMKFAMSRSFYQESGMSLRLGNAKIDPLVVVMNGGAPTLSTTKHAFDLDGDGKTENISFATGGSGFLAFDKNGDGTINDGNELFGPSSGNGFAELRAFDSDKNGWIDEADEIYGKLSVLTMTQDGQKTLFKLGDAGIGAIYLNDVSTQFEMKDMTNEYGEMKSSSIFLNEDGSMGTIHHIDLSI